MVRNITRIAPQPHVSGDQIVYRVAFLGHAEQAADLLRDAYRTIRSDRGEIQLPGCYGAGFQPSVYCEPRFTGVVSYGTPSRFGTAQWIGNRAVNRTIPLLKFIL